MISLGIGHPLPLATTSQRENDRARGRNHGEEEDVDLAEIDEGGGKDNPRRFFRRSAYLALAGLLTWGLTKAGQAGAEATMDGVRAEVALHHTVADHSKAIAAHEQAIHDLQAQVLPAPTAQRLIELLEADRKYHEQQPGGGHHR